MRFSGANYLNLYMMRIVKHDDDGNMSQEDSSIRERVMKSEK